MSDDGRNAVTWGVFPGQEIAQSTIIERESFLSWKACTSSSGPLSIDLTFVSPIIAQEEAFSIWDEWASFYRPGSEERNLLAQVRNKRWLVSIVHHDYKNPEGLWKFLWEEL